MASAPEEGTPAEDGLCATGELDPSETIPNIGPQPELAPTTGEDKDIVLHSLTVPSAGVFSGSDSTDSSDFPTMPSSFFSSFSPLGQMPNCSYRSKNEELVGGDFKLMLVDLDLGKSIGVEPLLLIGEVDDEESDSGVAMGGGGKGTFGGVPNSVGPLEMERII